MIEQLFSRDVVTVEADDAIWAADLLPAEAEFVRNAVDRRRREFAAGRTCARKALQMLGVAPQPLLVGQHREPLWPPGVVGSLTHCGKYCAAAVARAERFAGLGVDAEISERLDPELISTVCTSLEMKWARECPPPAFGDWNKVIFSAKESVYKCLFPLLRRVLEFHELTILLEPSSRSFSVTFLFELPGALSWLSSMNGRFEIGPEYLVTGVAVEATWAQKPS